MDEIEALEAAARQCVEQLRTVWGADERRALLKRMEECWEQAKKLKRSRTTDAR